jgi:hypothetical protein
MAKIPWSHIREAFAGEWVELVEYSWKGESLHPQAAIVRHHSANRSELLRKIAKSGRVDGAVVLFVGPSFPAFLTSAATSAHSSSL